MTKRPNILLITLDSLRPDHLGCYGYRGTETPHFDRLAAQGVRFENAYCQAPNTWMSHAALFTGCNPPRNGVRSPLGRLNPALPTLAETLRQAGYTTFGLPSVSLLSQEAGFARGFDVYEMGGLLSEFHGAVHFRDLQESLRLFRDWVRGATPPWFAWLHYFGIHVAQGTRHDGGSSVLDVPPSELARYSPFAQHYDAKIAYADRAFLGPVLETAQRHSGEQNLVAALMSDHGDDLCAIQAGLAGHDTHLGEQTMRVPLVLWSPGRLAKGIVVESPVRLVDVFPTMVELAELGTEGESPESTAESDSPLPTDGVSLGGLCKGLAETGSRPVYLENLYQGHLALREDRYKLVLSRPTVSGLYSRHVAWRLRQLGTALAPGRLLRPLRERRRRRQRRRHFAAAPETICRGLLDESALAALYDLQNDAGVQHNIAPEHPEIVASMRETLGRLSAGEVIATEGYSAEEEAEIHRRLNELGYL